jgi:hypothetical protein
MRWLVACALMTLLALTAPCLADVGAPGDTAAIRRELPVLVATYPQGVPAPFQSAQNIVIDDVFVEGRWAVAEWHAGSESSKTTLERIDAHWWLQPTSAAGLSAMSTALPRGSPGVISRNSGAMVMQRVNGFVLFLRLNLAGASRGLTYPSHISASRTAANAYFLFNIYLKSSAYGDVSRASMDVWFPFVLDRRHRYTISIACNGRPLGPIVGTLQNNSLHFDLPGFVIGTDAELTGQIDADEL